MTIAVWCVLAGALMPLLWTGTAKFTRFGGAGTPMGPRGNKAPREWLEQQDGYRQRANWAQHNAFEAFPPFAAAVIIAQQAGAAQGTVNALALAWVALRLAHGGVYLANVAVLRTIIWTAAWGCVIGLFIAAV